jgi:hypothetical protein
VDDKCEPKDRITYESGDLTGPEDPESQWQNAISFRHVMIVPAMALPSTLLIAEFRALEEGS